MSPDFPDILAWYDREGRDLPWRRTHHPYAVWVSEVMLQQTQVATVLPYYERWMTRFPTEASLASAEDQDILAYWQGLGYYRRCRSLVAGIRRCVAEGFPAGFEAWRAMPGVGDYTAAALASIIDGEPSPVVDGNVERVYARVAGDASVGDARRRASRAWAAERIDHARPGDWNQAIMEIGATVCRPKNPDCDRCPLVEVCVASATGRTGELPTPKPRPETIDAILPVGLWVRSDGAVAMHQAAEGEWWTGLWHLPRCEASGRPIANQKTTVTRHRLVIEVYRQEGQKPESARWVQPEELPSVPIPAPFRKLLAKLGL